MCSVPALIRICLSPVAQSSCCRESYHGGEEGSRQPETQVRDVESRFLGVLSGFQRHSLRNGGCLFSVFKVTGIIPEDGSAARRACDCEAEAGQAQHPEPSVERWAALSGAAPEAVCGVCVHYGSGSVYLHCDELTKGKKVCLRVLTVLVVFRSSKPEWLFRALSCEWGGVLPSTDG